MTDLIQMGGALVNLAEILYVADAPAVGIRIVFKGGQDITLTDEDAASAREAIAAMVRYGSITSLKSLENET